MAFAGIRDLSPIDPAQYQTHLFLFYALFVLVIDSKTLGDRSVPVKISSVDSLIMNIATTVETFQEDYKI